MITIGKIDPIQGLLDYIQDIKPYHTKVAEILTEYVHAEQVDVTMSESLTTGVGFVFPNALLDEQNANTSTRVGGFGGANMFGAPDPSAWPVVPTNTSATGPFDSNFRGYDSANNTVTIPGDRTKQYTVDQTITITIYDNNDDSVIDVETYEIVAVEYVPQTTLEETSHTKITVASLNDEGPIKSSNGNLTDAELYVTVTLAPFDLGSIIFGYGTATPVKYTAVGPPPSPDIDDQLSTSVPNENLFDPTRVNSFVIAGTDVTAVFVTGSILEHTDTGDIYRVLFSTVDGSSTIIRVVETIPAYTPETGSIKIREQIPGYSDSFLSASGAAGTLSTTIADSVAFSWTDSGTNDVMYGYQYLIQASSGNDLIVNGINLEFAVEVGDSVKILGNPDINGIYEVTGVANSTISVTPGLTTSQGGFVEKYEP